jgi:NAD(P)-dependent dehydrogenase (short-subunit alcohol dehydrogenase family)
MAQTGGRLAGKVAIITGGGQGIGAAIAQGYAGEGAKVLITGRTMSKLEDIAGKIAASGGTCIPLEALAGEAAQSKLTVDRAICRMGARRCPGEQRAHLHRLPARSPIQKMEENCKVDFQSAFFGSLQLMQLCYPHMVAQGGGSIINMGSSYGIRCEPGFLAYAASKEAIRTLTKHRRARMGQAGHPGEHHPALGIVAQVASGTWRKASTYDLELAKVAMGRFGAPEDIAPTASSWPATIPTSSPARRSASKGGAIML